MSDTVEGHDPMILSTLIRDEARIFSFVLREKDEGTIKELALPDKSGVICVYREEKFLIPSDDEKLKSGDEIFIITHRDYLSALKDRWLNNVG